MSKLTRREAQIVVLIAEGKSTTLIASELGITAFTVQKHRNNISKKFELHTTTQLVSFAISRSAVVPIETAPVSFDDLTGREREILRELSLGRTSKQIARNLGISPRTVSKHLENIKRKTHARTLASLMKMSIEISDKDVGK
ncbi:LuxR C-terminal-related transcriptional regulator [Paraburkholderia flagellata]|uniref:LuxR C-terminal-related transcriptional regulator n=1 Tax=Paraburkholderia flagellata TaxID=2883241 RepID=UPI001F48DA0C|nr:LuxR C-terminal-related transcriptional regulator [Paraburkholderia flagellata]